MSTILLQDAIKRRDFWRDILNSAQPRPVSQEVHTWLLKQYQDADNFVTELARQLTNEPSP